MKILFQSIFAKSGGSVTYARNLLQELQELMARGEQGDSVYVFYLPLSVVGLSALATGDNRIALLSYDAACNSAWRRFLHDQWTLRRIVSSEDIAVLISGSDFGMLRPPCRQILLLRNSLFFSPYYLERILKRKSRRFRMEFLLRRLLITLSVRCSDVVITGSQSMLNDVRRFVPIPDGKAIVNYFGVPLEKFNVGRWDTRMLGGEEAGRQQDAPLRMLYVSEYSDYKNLTTLLKAVLLLREERVDGLCLVTTADPNQFPDVEITSREEDKALASHPLLVPFVEFTGPVPYDEIPKLYQQSDLFVFPSLAESFGHPLVEAMASGLPIIASDIPICREICGEAAVYFSPLESSDLAEKILLLWNNADLRRRLGQLGRKRAETYFDWKHHVRRLVEIIEWVAADR